MVVYIAMDQMVGDRRSPRGENTGFRDRLPHPPTIALLPLTGSVRRGALWTVYEMAGPVLPNGFDVAAFRIGLDVAASLTPAVVAAASTAVATLQRHWASAVAAQTVRSLIGYLISGSD